MKTRAPGNRTLSLSAGERQAFSAQLLHLHAAVPLSALANRIVNDNLLEIIDFLPDSWVDLMLLDPPYNRDKDFHGRHLSQLTNEKYLEYLESWFPR